MQPKMLGAAVLALLILSTRPLAAQPPPTDPAASAGASSERRLELAREVIKATAMDATMAAAFHNMAGRMTASAGANLSADRQARMKIIGDAEGDALAKLVPQIVQSMVTGYAQTFTEQELSDILAFYRSPSGRSMVAKTPQFMQGMMVQMASLMPQMRREMSTEICAKLDCTAAEKSAYLGPQPPN